MSKLNILQELVEDILRTKPETRDSDNKLYVNVLSAYGLKYKVDFSHVSIMGAYKRDLKFGDFKLPPIESVGRCRRKLQEMYPELRGTDDVEKARSEEEIIYREYART